MAVGGAALNRKKRMKILEYWLLSCVVILVVSYVATASAET